MMGIDYFSALGNLVFGGKILRVMGSAGLKLSMYGLVCFS